MKPTEINIETLQVYSRLKLDEKFHMNIVPKLKTQTVELRVHFSGKAYWSSVYKAGF
jgi:hypothetical protein